MKPFHQWTQDLAESMDDNKPDKAQVLPGELDGHEDPDAEGGYRYPCRVCGENTDIICDPDEFDPDNHYCGRSPSCCP